MNHAPMGPVGILGDDNNVAQVGVTLTARPNALQDADGIKWDTMELQWLRDGVEIAGETAGTYIVSQDDTGAQISVLVRYEDNRGFWNAKTSNPVGVPGPELSEQEAAIAAIYTLILGRPPKPEGAKNMAAELDQGVEVSELARRMERNRDQGAT